MTDLTERMQAALDRGIGNISPETGAIFNEAITALSPVLPDEAKAIWCYLRANGQTDAASLLERQGLSQASLSKIIAEQQERIEELEDQWYPPAHMDAVQERTIDPLRAKVKELEAHIHELLQAEAVFNSRIRDLRAQVKELEGLIDRIAEDDNPDNFWQEDAKVMRAERNE